jgi:hypothetical protein
LRSDKFISEWALAERTAFNAQVLISALDAFCHIVQPTDHASVTKHLVLLLPQDVKLIAYLAITSTQLRKIASAARISFPIAKHAIPPNAPPVHWDISTSAIVFPQNA